MSLPWVRLEADIAAHDKVLALLSDPSPRRWQAMASYVFALGWSGAHGTDGHIPATALPFVHGTTMTARLLVKHRMWEENGTGWHIHNFGQRQELSAITEGKRAAQRTAARKTNCQRYHGKWCGCWRKDGEDST